MQTCSPSSRLALYHWIMIISLCLAKLMGGKWYVASTSHHLQHYVTSKWSCAYGALGGGAWDTAKVDVTEFTDADGVPRHSFCRHLSCVVVCCISFFAPPPCAPRLLIYCPHPQMKKQRRTSTARRQRRQGRYWVWVWIRHLSPWSCFSWRTDAGPPSISIDSCIACVGPMPWCLSFLVVRRISPE